MKTPKTKNGSDKLGKYCNTHQKKITIQNPIANNKEKVNPINLKVPNKTIENKNIQNKQIKLNMRPTNFNGQLLTDNLTNGHQRNSKAKKALESK